MTGTRDALAKRFPGRQLGGCAIALALALGWGVSSQAAAEETLATVFHDWDAIVFEPAPSAKFDSLTVSLSGPEGVHLRQEFAAGDSVFIKLVDSSGSPLPDGQYAYELVATPALSAKTREAMAAARESGDRATLQAALRASGALPAEDLVQSGYFRISGGVLVDPEEAVEEAAVDAGGPGKGKKAPDDSVTAADQVINDDLIVRGSACIGFDCVNGESFGFDTLRLKENNLRIHFFDTSTAAAFPSNDWRLTANDSANGGANRFSIEDASNSKTPFTVEGNAPSHSLFVDDGGRVGFGTNGPAVETHVKDGDTPTHRLEQDGTSGFTPQIWDVAGNETNFFIRDATFGSRLPFRIRPNAPTSSIDIEGTTGDVGFGTTAPDSAIHVLRSNNASTRIKIQNTNGAINRAWELVLRASDGEFAINDPDSAGAEFIFTGGGASGGLTVAGDVTCNGTAPCFNDLSDLRYKVNVRNLTGAGEIVRQLRPILWENERGTVSTGLAAQEVADVMTRNGIPKWSGHTYKEKQDKHYLSYTAIVALLVAAHQEKDSRIDELAKTVAALQVKLEQLQPRSD